MIESNVIIINFRLCVVSQNASGLVGVNYISVSGSTPYVDAELDIELLDGEGFVELDLISTNGRERLQLKKQNNNAKGQRL